VAAVAPFGPLDRQRLLAAPDPAARADLLAELLADEERFLRARLDLS
jgi:Lon protease-like protein